MFFKQIISNMKKNRKDNGLFFATLLIAIIAFYTLLSLESLDVMQFLKTIEGDAIRKLMLLVPFIYVVSLFFVFFLVYFAYRYQMENRRREFGLYLMLGMKRIRLFLMLMCETILNSMLSILVGIPTALLLTECISLATARLVGLGIVGHQFTLSAAAIAGTILGFFLVQLAAMLILSVKFCRMDPAALLRTETETVQKTDSGKRGVFFFFSGLLLLVFAYLLGIFYLQSLDVLVVALILLCGSAGTFLLYRGLGAFIGKMIQKQKDKKDGLYTFTGRQIQESVLHQHTSLAVSSLLLLLALACISFGIGMGVGRTGGDVRVCDFSLLGTEDEVASVLDRPEVQTMVADCYPMYLGMPRRLFHIDYSSENASSGENASSSENAPVEDLSLEGILLALKTVPQSNIRDNIIKNIQQKDGYNDMYLIPVSSYNALLHSIGEPQIDLSTDKIALFSAEYRASAEFSEVWDQALKSGAYAEFVSEDGTAQRFEILPQMYYNNIVADRAITLYVAMIVPDEVYLKWIDPDNAQDGTTQDNMAQDDMIQEITEPTGDLSEMTAFCYNIHLKDEIVDEQGLLPAILQMQKLLNESGLEYDSYLGGIGRKLFYTVAASYLSIYLGVLFLLIANTVLALKYLIWQKQNRSRYLTLLMLGAQKQDISRSMGSQIRLYFLLVLIVAILNSVFAIVSMFTSFLKLPAGTSIQASILLTGIAFLCFIVIELIYISIVQRKSRREILMLHHTERTED